MQWRVAAIGFALAAGLAAAALARTTSTPRAPVQPIDFSHRAHLEADHLDCEYCHSSARRSSVASVPPVELCMGCHRYVDPAHPEIIKLTRYWDLRQPILWRRVTAVPRFVHFRHDAHVRAGVACQTCHGPVETMDHVVQTQAMTMGWCVDCHRSRRAPVDCLTCHY